MLQKVVLVLRMIKVEHSVFALPFAFISALVAADGFLSWSTLFWILVAMVAARSCAMAFNRVADYKLRQFESADAKVGSSCGVAYHSFCTFFHTDLFNYLCVCRLQFESSRVSSFSSCSCNRFLLLLHQTLYSPESLVHRTGAWHCPCRSLDCGARLT